MSYFPEPYTHSKSKIKVELDLSNYVTNSDLKSAAEDYTSKFANVVHLANLKSVFEKLDIVKLETTPVDLSKLSYVVKSEVVRRLNIMNWLKKLMLFKVLIPAI